METEKSAVVHSPQDENRSLHLPGDTSLGGIRTRKR